MVPSDIKGKPVPKIVSNFHPRRQTWLVTPALSFSTAKFKGENIPLATKEKLLETKISIVALCRFLASTDLFCYVATPSIYSVL